MGHSQKAQEEPPQPLSCFPGICGPSRGSPSRGSLIPRKSVRLKDEHATQKHQAFYRNHWNCGVSYAQGQMGWSQCPRWPRSLWLNGNLSGTNTVANRFRKRQFWPKWFQTNISDKLTLKGFTSTSRYIKWRETGTYMKQKDSFRT